MVIKRLFWKLCRLTSSPYSAELPADCTMTVPSPPRPLVTAPVSAATTGAAAGSRKSSINAESGLAIKELPKLHESFKTSA